MRSRFRTAAFFLLIFLISLTFLSLVPAQSEWLSIDEITVNNGISYEVANGQTLRFDVKVSSYGMGSSSKTEATVGLNISNSSLVYEFANQSSEIFPNQEYSFNFSITVPSGWLTGEYNVDAFVTYNKSTENETLVSHTTIRVIKLTAGSLTMAHPDATAGETVKFIQDVDNVGNVSANATVRVWIYWDEEPDGDFEPQEVTTPSKEEITNNTLQPIETVWVVKSTWDDTSLTGCEHAVNYSRYYVPSSWRYGAVANFYATGKKLDSFNFSFVEVGDSTTEECVGGFCHSGLDVIEVSPSDIVSGSIELKNRANVSVVIHEVRAWVEDSGGEVEMYLLPSDPTLPKSVDRRAYVDVSIPGHRSNCDTVIYGQTNYDSAIEHLVAKEDFPFAGSLPTDLPTDDTYKVVFAVDYGVPRESLTGSPWNILWNASFNLVKAEVVNITTYPEVTWGATQKITTIINNTGSATLSSGSVLVQIFNSTGDQLENFTGSVSNLASGETQSLSFNWGVPSTLPLGIYSANSTVYSGSGYSDTKSTTFNVVYLATSNVTADPITPYETKNVSVHITNDGPTNATMNSIETKILANATISLGSINDTVVQSGSNYTFNFPHYFDPSGQTNGSYELEIDEEYGKLSFSITPKNITLLPIGIKSFTAPTSAVNATPFNVSVVLSNIGGSNVTVTLNLTANSTTLNQTDVIALNNTETTSIFTVNLTNGTYTMVVNANYSGLPQTINRSSSITLSVVGAELSIEASNISVSPSSPTTGQNVTINATIHNTGGADARDFLVEFLVNGTSQENNTLSVSKGTSNSTVFYWTAIEGTHNITIMVDPGNIILGEDESNNNATTTVTVSAPSVPTVVSYAETGGSYGLGVVEEVPPEPVYLKEVSGIELTGSGIVDIIERSGDAYSARKYIIDPSYASLAGVYASQGEVVLSPELSESLFSKYEAAKEGLIIKKEPAPLEGDQYEIAAKLALEMPQEGGTIVISRGDLEVDSVAASSFASAVNAKMLLVKPDKIPFATLNALERLRPTFIYIIGGPSAVSPKVEDILNIYCFRCERIAGKTRYETSLEVAKRVQELKKSNIVILTGGQNPVLYASSLAVKFNAPIVYMDEFSPPDTEVFLSEKDFSITAKLYTE